MSTFNELIDFTRSTTGTYLDSVVYGPELVVNGTFDTDFTGWTDVSTGTGSIAVVSGQAQLTRVNINNRGFISQGITVVAGATYKVQITEVSGQAYVGVGTTDIGTTFLAQPLATGENTFYITPNATSVYINVRGIVDGVQLIDNVSVKEIIGGQVSGTPLLRTAAINEPRLEYDASGNPLGLLIEDGRTNVLAYSEGYTTGWDDINISSTANAIASPDGAVSGAKLQEDSSGTGGPRVYPNDAAVLTANQAQTISCFFKAGTSSYAYLTIRHTNQNIAGAEFDLATGTVNSTRDNGNMTLNGSGITSVGNGWYRCSVTATCSVSTSSGLYFLGISDGTGILNGGYPLYTLTGKNIYAWGAQVESGAFPTSYIPTSGSTVTRAKDLASLPVERFAYNQPQGTVVAFQETFGTAGNLVPWEIHTANTNRIVYNAKSSTATIITGGSVQASLNHADQLPSVFYKQGLAFKKDDIASSLDASTLTDTSGTIPTVSSFKIGTDYSLLAMLNGHIKSIQYYPKRLSNEELELLTQPSASPTMNLTFDGQATSTLVEGLHD